MAIISLVKAANSLASLNWNKRPTWTSPTSSAVSSTFKDPFEGVVVHKGGMALANLLR